MRLRLAVLALVVLSLVGAPVAGAAETQTTAPPASLVEEPASPDDGGSDAPVGLFVAAGVAALAFVALAALSRARRRAPEA